MIRISREQFRRMATKLALSNASRFVDSVLIRFPEFGTTAQRATLRGIVSDVISKAISYGITDIDDIEKFLHIRILLGENFYQRHDWASQILLYQGFGSMSEKLNYLYDKAHIYLKRKA